MIKKNPRRRGKIYIKIRGEKSLKWEIKPPKEDNKILHYQG